MKRVLTERAGVVLTPLCLLGVWLIPLPLDPQAHRLAAIFAAVVVAWITEVIPISMTALMIAPLMIAAGVTDAKSAFAPYADPLIFLFIGGFFIARAMTRHGLDRRIAYSLMSSRWVHGSPARMRIAFMLAGLLLSMWISNTATSAILIPILLGTMAGSDPERRAGGVLAVAYACSIGGMGSLVGSPPNVITVRFLQNADIDFGFVEWMAVGLPTALVLLFVLGMVLHKLEPPPAVGIDPEYEKPPWSYGELVTAVSFGLAVFGWMAPGIYKAMDGPYSAEIVKALPGGAVAILAASVLFVFRDRTGERVLPWHDAMKIDWGIILLFGGGISLGNQMFETGLASVMSQWFVQVSGVESVWGLSAALIAFTIFFTEVCSNTASSNMLVPLAIAAAIELGVSPLPPALAVGLTASCAFMLPIATGPNAVAYGTGLIQLRPMMRLGFVLNIICGVTLFLVLRAIGFIAGWG